MSDWASYQIQDFIPFTADVYFRLLARMGETFWPLQMVTLLAGLLALYLSLTGRARLALVLIAPLWVLIGVAFFAQRYSGLNWAGAHLCWVWIVQGVFLLLLAITRWGVDSGNSAPLSSPPVQAGLLIGLCGLFGFPLLGVALGNDVRSVEVFGLHPDPTAAVTLGLLLIGVRGGAMWLATLVPALWLIVSALTLRVLDAPWYPALLVIVVVAMTGGMATHHLRTVR